MSLPNQTGRNIAMLHPMKTGSILLFSLALILAAPETRAQPEELPEAHEWRNSVVLLDVRRKNYDYLQPWATPMQNVQKSGVVIGPDEILTTAEHLSDTTLIRLQKHGRGQWFRGEVRWIDYHANLAVVTTPEEGFWDDLAPVRLANPVDQNATFRVVRWRAGKLETRRADFNQFTIQESALSYANYLHMEMNSEITDVGNSEPAVAGSLLAGLIIGKAGSSCRVIPSCFIQSVLESRANGTFAGLGWFDFTWQPAENPGLLQFLNYTNRPAGVVVIKVREQNKENPFQPRDIILKIDGMEIDTTGDYKEPAYGHLSLEHLATRNRWAGDTVQFTVWRDGQLTELNYRIPRADDSATLLPYANFDQRPEYLIVGGLVFQPLSNSYLRSWGGDWRRRSPFRLYHFNNEDPTPERPSRVLLSQVLPDPVNLGYQEQRNLILDRVNGRIVSTLTDIQRAMEHPQDGFHTFEFLESTTLRTLVLDANEQKQATERILARYGIDLDHVIHTAPGAITGPVQSAN